MKLAFKYSQMNDIMRIVKEYNLEIINTDFQLECSLYLQFKEVMLIWLKVHLTSITK